MGDINKLNEMLEKAKSKVDNFDLTQEHNPGKILVRENETVPEDAKFELI